MFPENVPSEGSSGKALELGLNVLMKKTAKGKIFSSHNFLRRCVTVLGSEIAEAYEMPSFRLVVMELSNELDW